MTLLTPEQSRAIEFPQSATSKHKKHLIIEAGAGAGKTFVLTERVKWLLFKAPKSVRLHPARLYLVTFSRAAERELKERVQRKLAESGEALPVGFADLIHVSTIDSLFNKLLESKFHAWWEAAATPALRERYGVSYTSTPSPQIVSESTIAQRLEKRLELLLRECTSDDATEGMVLDFILAGGFRSGFGGNRSTTRAGLLRALTSEAFLSFTHNKIIFASRLVHPAATVLLEKMLDLAREEFLRRILHGEFTHGDRTIFLHSLFCLSPLEKVRTPFENVLDASFPIAPSELIVDEYQDTSELQHEILLQLVKEPNGRMVVVGDPKQSIYGFRNAHVGVFKNLVVDPQWEHIELKTNFRSEPTLLGHINALSKATFSHIDPNLPPEFVNSDFYKAAQKYYVPANALKEFEGTKNTYQFVEKVQILGASLNPDRASEEITVEKEFSLPQFQFWVLAQHLKKVHQEKGLPWNNIVVLCESNKRVRSVAEALGRYHIPTVALCSGQQDLEELDTPWNRVALILAQLLQGPVDTAALYELLISPLVGATHDEVELFFRFQQGNTEYVPAKNILKKRIDSKQSLEKRLIKVDNAEQYALKNFPHIDAALKLVQDRRNVAKYQFFAAWQTLRWSLCLLNSGEKENTARQFAAEMDGFATSLSDRIESRTLKRNLENALDDANFVEQHGAVLPQNLADWNLPLKASEFAEQSQMALKVMTVHAAKGLEWPCVVFWPSVEHEEKAEFAVILSQDRVLLKWLQTDLETLSAVKRIKNAAFDENDAVTVSDRDGSKTVWFSDLQKKLERAFERQRIFYTAFTRAKEQLVLCFPPANRNFRRSLRDKLGDVKESESSYTEKMKLKNLEDCVLTEFLDTHFLLRKPDVRGAAPTTPWLGRETAALPKTENDSARFDEYGPDWYKDFLSEAKSAKEGLESSNRDGNKLTETAIQPSSFVLGPTSTPAVQWRELRSIAIHEKKLFEKSMPPSSGVGKIEASAHGVRFHAAQEHGAVHSERSIDILKKAALINFHEFEIWAQDERPRPISENCALISPGRRVVDLLSVFQARAVPKELLQARIKLKEGELRSLGEHVGQRSETPCLFVVDFKTGRPSLSHVEQLQNYMTLIKRLATPQWFQRLTPSLRHEVSWKNLSSPLILGVLCYELPHSSQFFETTEGRHFDFLDPLTALEVWG